MGKVIFRLLIILSLCSCYHVPRDPSFSMDLVMPADSMVSLLTDMHLVDGVIANARFKDKHIENISNEYVLAVLDKHKVGRDTFEESLRYYAYHTEELSEIYERVIVNLSKIESQVRAK